MLDVKGSWKGKLWFLFFIWPFIGFTLTKSYLLNDEEQTILISILLITAWLIWLYFLYRLINLIRGK